LPLIVPRVPPELYPRFGTESAEGFSPPRAKRFNRYRSLWKTSYISSSGTNRTVHRGVQKPQRLRADPGIARRLCLSSEFL